MEGIAHVVIEARGLQVHAAGGLAGLTALRVGAISGLLWSDVDLRRGFVTVSCTVEEDDDGSLLEHPPKNGRARVVPMPAVACEELRAWVFKEYGVKQAQEWLGHSDPASGPLTRPLPLVPQLVVTRGSGGNMQGGHSSNWNPRRDRRRE